MTCDNCIHAIWKRTSNGRLHPSKSGRCGFVWEPPPIPKAFFFYGGMRLSGGYIERGDDKTDGCICYSAAPALPRPHLSTPEKSP